MYTNNNIKDIVMEFVYILMSKDLNKFKIGKSSDYQLKRVDELSRNWMFDYNTPICQDNYL